MGIFFFIIALIATIFGTLLAIRRAYEFLDMQVEAKAVPWETFRAVMVVFMVFGAIVFGFWFAYPWIVITEWLWLDIVFWLFGLYLSQKLFWPPFYIFKKYGWNGK